MCLLFHKNNRVRVAKKDIKVYKVIWRHGEELCSPFKAKYKWELNKKHTVSELGIIKGMEGGYDGDDSDFARKVWGEDNTWSVAEGLHAALTKERLVYPHYSNEFIYEAIIPAGSKYIKGATNLIVSDQLILVKEVK